MLLFDCRSLFNDIIHVYIIGVLEENLEICGGFCVNFLLYDKYQVSDLLCFIHSCPLMLD